MPTCSECGQVYTPTNEPEIIGVCEECIFEKQMLCDHREIVEKRKEGYAYCKICNYPFPPYYPKE